ncbi:DUF3822 family protein [Parapedobacter tibetensis]|uniref:DUF3822 family protein n=1 Tax=Parapedobacter tibetensis TaxID=2972951 RepID=UPI00214D6F04|nr:DUF3822 family protein [Parapedobacter tibetensis]
MTYTSTDFDAQRLDDYTLLVRIDQDENALAIIDNERQLKFIGVYDPAKVTQQIGDILNLGFVNVKITALDNGYSFIPADVFDEVHLPTYRRYLPNDNLSDPFVSDIPPIGVKLVGQINRLGLVPFLERFPHAGVHSSVQVLLNGVAGYGAKAGGRTLAIHKAATSVGFYLFDSGKFCYGNDFEVYDADDLNYYLLSVLEHFELEGKQPDILLSGDLTTDDAYYQRITKYSENIAFADVGELTGITIPAELQQHQHRFFTLFGLNLCE